MCRGRVSRYLLELTKRKAKRDALFAFGLNEAVKSAIEAATAARELVRDIEAVVTVAGRVVAGR